MKILANILLLLSIGSAQAGQDAAPSSHLVYNGGFEGDIIINEVRVPINGEAMYTYYEALGWGGKAGGYAGIQAHPKAHNYIFSIWDHKEHTAPIKAVYHGPGTLTENFGGEGTGLKSWNFELGWDTDVWYTLVSRCWAVDDHTFYAYWVRSDKTKQWTHMITMDVAAKDAYFHGGNDSFIEDWLETGKNARTTNLRNGWKRKLDGQWHAFGTAKYSVNSWDLTEGKRSFNYKTNWNGGVSKDETGEFYFMTAGGKDTKPTAENPSLHEIMRIEEKPNFAPIKITKAVQRKTTIEWETDPTTLSQFSYTIAAYDNPECKGEPVKKIENIEPHQRSFETKATDLYFRIQCTDILGNVSAFQPVVK
jgi:hypothetical protein